MSIIDKKTVEHVAHLSRIELAQEELNKLSAQLEQILHFIDSLSLLDVKDIEPTSHILPISNILREDLPKPSISCEKALSNAPGKKGKFFSVPKVIE